MADKPPTDLWTFYDQVRALESELRRAGHVVQADAVDQAMTAGATSGEILGDLGLAFDGIQASIPTHSAEAARLRAFVDVALRPPD